MKKIEMVFCLIFLLSHLIIIAQTSITGKLTDKETGEEMIGGNIVVFQNGTFVQGMPTDIDGNFSIQLDAGVYDVEVSYTGYRTQKIMNVSTMKGRSTIVDVQLRIGGFYGGCGMSIGWRIPLIRLDEMFSEHIIINDQIRHLPTRNIREISLSTPGVSFSQ